MRKLTHTINTTRNFNDNIKNFQYKILELANTVREGCLQSYNIKNNSVVAEISAGVKGHKYIVTFTLTSQ